MRDISSPRGRGRLRTAVPCRAAQRGAVLGRLGWTAAVVVLLAALLFAGLTWGPNLARDRIAAYFSDVLGHEVKASRIGVSLFAGRLEIDDVTIASSEPGAPMLAVRKAVVDFDLLPYLRGLVVVRSLELDGPRVRVVRIAPGRFDFSDTLDRFANRPVSGRKTDWRVERIAIADGAVVLDDRVVGKTTTIDALALSAEGLTNRDADAQQAAALQTGFRLDGRPVSAQVRGTPFAPDPVFDGSAKLDGLPIAPFAPYLRLPADVRIAGGALHAEVSATWRKAVPAPGALALKGRASMDGLSVQDAAGRDRVGAASIALTLAESFPLGGALHVSDLSVRGPRGALERDAAGALTWPLAGAPGPGTMPAERTAPPQHGATADAPVAAAPAAAPASLRIDRIAVDGATFDWQDASLPAPLALRVAPISLHAESIEIADLATPSRVRGKLRLDATVDGDATVTADVVLEGDTGRVTSEFARVDLARYAPLAGPSLRATVDRGRLAARAVLGWNTGSRSWTVTDGAAELTDLAISRDGRQPATVRSLALSRIAVDPTARRVEVASAKLDGASLKTARGRDGRLDVQDWWTPVGGAGATTPAPAAATPKPTSTGPAAAPPPPPGPPWAIRLAQAEIAGLVLDYDDALIARDRKLPTVTLDARVTDITLDPTKPVAFEASAALADGSRLSTRGTVKPSPLALDTQVRLQRVSIANVDPYVAPYVNVSLASGQLWSNGRLRLTAGTNGAVARIGWDGEVSVNELRAIDKVSGDDFLRWNALAMPSVKVDWRMGRPGDSLIEIGAVAIVDFYARVILSPEGRLNLTEILVDPARAGRGRSLTVSPDAADPRAPRAAAPTTTPAATDEREARERQVAYGTGVEAGRPRETGRSATVARDAGPRPTVRVGTVRIASGNVNFTDLFIRPNYTANLTQLVGSIEAIASDRSEPSDVLITGRVDDDTPLEITGQVNPLAPRSFVDLRAVARGFDLPKLSPYSGRWAGYAIEKGKLTADVQYRIEGDRLSAQNRLTINQLTFGDKVDSPDATSLPVRLAVSLLKDRNGNIDLDLPISGTVSDPQFSVGGLLWRAIGNLVVRVVTSPFSFLASIGGAQDAGELSHIEFPPGVATLDDEDRKRLDGLANALVQRPELSIEIAGVGDPKADRDALAREHLERSLRGAKLGQLRRANPTAELPSLSEVTIDAAERPALLERAWRDAKLDAAAAGKVPSPAEIEQLLLERAAVGNEEVRQVAQQRAQVARDHLRDVRAISNERLFLLAPRIADDEGKLPPRRADFTVK